MDHIKIPLLVLLGLLIHLPSFAQTDRTQTQTQTIDLYLDCNRCNESYIRQEIPYVNYVRNQEDSDIHLLVTRQRTGSGGTEFTLRFLGRDQFSGKNDTLIYVSPNSDTEQDERSGLVRVIQIGLLPYLAGTGAIDNLSVTYRQPEEEAETKSQVDKWNYWVFELDGRSFFNGEEKQNFIYLSGGASADRVTPELKINLNYDYDYNRRSFTREDSLGNSYKDVFITRGQRFNGIVVKSISEHWSAGVFTEAFSSTRNNIELSAAVSPALEYNIYPYDEYTSHEISFLFGIPFTYNDYDEVTIYNQRSEFLLQPQIRSRVDFTQPWGEIEGRFNASAYLKDLSKNRLDMNLEFDFRIFRGLQLSLSGRYSIINDQLNIPAGDITDEQQLLNLRQQLTSFSYGGSIGIEYSFGSIYNNVVNPRF